MSRDETRALAEAFAIIVGPITGQTRDLKGFETNRDKILKAIDALDKTLVEAGICRAGSFTVFIGEGYFELVAHSGYDNKAANAFAINHHSKLLSPALYGGIVESGINGKPRVVAMAAETCLSPAHS